MQTQPIDAPPGLRCEARRVGRRGVRLALTGELDIATVDAVELALRAAELEGCSPIVLDLSGLTFIDAAGLHLALRADARARAARSRLVVVCGSRTVGRLLELAPQGGSLRVVEAHPGGSGPPASQGVRPKARTVHRRPAER